MQQKDYEEDFLKDNPTLQQHIRRLQSWRDRYENFLDSRPRVQPLDLLSPWLVEYQYSKVDDIEVPGQYLEVSHSFSNRTLAYSNATSTSIPMRNSLA